MGAPLVFISHSCRDDLIENSGNTPPATLYSLRYAQRVRDSLVARLTAELGEDSWWFDSKRVARGDLWEQRIVDALHECDAAAVLLTPESADSEWVIREITILLDRKLREPDLTIVPIYFAGMTPQLLSKKRAWRAIPFLPLQGVVATHGSIVGVDGEADHNQILRDALTDLVAGATATREFRADLPFWSVDLPGLLADMARERLDLAASGVSLSPAHPWDERRVRCLARAIVSVESSATDPPAQDPLLKAVAPLVTNSRPSLAQDICRTVAPAAAPHASAVALANASLDPSLDLALCATARLTPTDADLAFAKSVVKRSVRLVADIKAHTGVFGEDEDVLADASLVDWLDGWAIAGPSFLIVPLGTADPGDVAELGHRLREQLEMWPRTRPVALVPRTNTSSTDDVPAGTVVIDPSDEKHALKVGLALNVMERSQK